MEFVQRAPCVVRLLTDAASRGLLLYSFDLTQHLPRLLLDPQLPLAVLMKSEVFVNLAPFRLVEIFYRLMSCELAWLTMCTIKDNSQYHAVTMPHPCRFPAMPCRAAKGLDCVFPILFTLWPFLLYTRHAAPVPYHDRALPRMCLATTIPS
jgi:hypothetical protein